MEAKEPTPLTAQRRALRELIAVMWLTLGSTSSPSAVWPGLLDRLEETFSEDADPVADRDDFLTDAAGMLASALEMLAKSNVDVDRPWSVVTSRLEALDERLIERDAEPFFVPWLTDVRASLSHVGGEDALAQIVDRVHEVLDSQTGRVRVLLAEAYIASLPEDGW